MPSLIGNKPNQVPSNGDLGTLAFQDASNVKAGSITADTLTVDTTTLVVDATNNRVGVGTASPSTILELSANNTGAENNTLRLTDTATNTTTDQQIGKIEFYSSDTSSPGAGVKSYIGAFANDGTPEAYLAFATADGVAQATERMRITSAGNVGIGTSSPSALLNIERATSLDATATTNGKGTIYLQAAGNSTSSTGQILNAISFSGQGTGRRRAMIANLQSGASLTGGDLAFYTNDTSSSVDTVTERMRITSTGNLQFNSGYGSVATAYGCRAWVNFNGTGTVAIRASGNVSSITDNGTGDYTVNFTTAMPDANYSGCVNGMEFSTGTADWFFSPKRDSSYGTTFQTGSFRVTATGDAGAVVVAIFR